MNRIQKINGHPTFGVRFVVCGNLEHLDADYRNSGYTKSEAELAVSKAAGDVITQAGYDYEVDTIHRNWAGGQHYQFATLRGQVAVYLYAAETTDDGDDDDRARQSNVMTCECVQCCGGDHPGECRECAGWGDRIKENGIEACEFCTGTGVCHKCNGAPGDDTSWRLLRDVREIPADVLAEVERAQNAAEAAMTRVAERINDEAEAE